MRNKREMRKIMPFMLEMNTESISLKTGDLNAKIESYFLG